MRDLNDPRVGGVRRKADFMAYERRVNWRLFWTGLIMIAIGLAALGVFVYRGGW